ncbi:MAG: pentapeptide repeat-containing protein [Nitrospirae bacterium]|nr:pentapeptide repeat-containing protein [Nitrospirota bacterium]
MPNKCSYVFEDNNKVKSYCEHEVFNDSKYCVFHDQHIDQKSGSFDRAFEKLIKHCERENVSQFDFKGFKFPKFNFQKKTFRKNIDFRAAEFLGDLNFDHTRFLGEVNFLGAKFHGISKFQGSTFHGKARFMGVTFNKKTIFVGGEFKKDAVFHGCKFMENAAFQGRHFSYVTVFQMNTFYKDADFQNCNFQKGVDFSKTLFRQRSNFSNAIFNDEINLSGTNLKKLKGLKGDGVNFEGAVLESAEFWELPKIEECSFKNAFLISCNFSHKEFVDCDFTGAVFKEVFTKGWMPDEKTRKNTKYVFTDYEILETITAVGYYERKYQAISTSRVPLKGDFGDEENVDFTIFEFAKEPYKWEYILDLPYEIQTGIVNYINFFRDYVRSTKGIDVDIATNPVGKKIKLSFITDEKNGEEVKHSLRQYILNLFRPFNQQLEIEFNNPTVTDYDKQLLLINYQNELLNNQTRLIFALQDLKVRGKTAESIEKVITQNDSNDNKLLLQMMDKLVDKVGGTPPITIEANATATNTANISVNIQNKNEIRHSLADLYDELRKVCNEKSSKLADTLCSEIDTALNEKGEDGSILQRTKSILSGVARFVGKAADYGIKNVDNISKICEQLGKLLQG